MFFTNSIIYYYLQGYIGDVQYSEISTIVAVRAWRSLMSCPRSLQTLMLSRVLPWISDSRPVTDHLEKKRVESHSSRSMKLMLLGFEDCKSL